MKNFIKFFVILIGGLLIFEASGKRADTTMKASLLETQIPNDIEDWLAYSESRVENLRPNAAKEIIWHDPKLKNKTKLSIVYIHGFTASKVEIAPTPQLIAKAMGANLYLTRLSGHGRDSNALDKATLSDWADDMVETLSIAKKLGDEVVIVSGSTGAALAIWAIRQPELANNIRALITLSPNFALIGISNGLLNMPWANELLSLYYGERLITPPQNEQHAKGWTNNISTQVLIKLGALLKVVSNTDFSKIEIPHLVFYSTKNTLVSYREAEAVLELWGGPSQTVNIENSLDKNNHILSGDIFAPNSTQKVVDESIKWISLHSN